MPTRRTILSITLSLSLLLSLSSSTSLSSTCKSTPHPNLCRWMLSAFNSSSPLINYSKFSLKQSLKHAKRLSNFLTRHVPDNIDGPLSDCSTLFDLNVDYLHSIIGELTSNRLNSAELVGRVEAMLSGVVTNQMTCYDGMRESEGGWSEGVARAIHAPVVNGTEIYSVALGLVTHALGKSRGKSRRVKRHKNSNSGFTLTGRVLEESHGSWEHSFKIFEALRHYPTSIQADSDFGETRRRLEGDIESSSMIIKDTVVVSPYGDGNFTTINEAIRISPNNSKVEDGYFVVYIKQGYYQEYVIVSKHKKGIMLLGDGINRTVISGTRNVLDGWTTFNSATFAVAGERFVAVGITFVNIAGPEKHQAVAVRNNADLSTFFRCSFMGYQDTLYVHSMRQFYRECDIYGTVDFIFGNSASVFQNCNLYARKPLPGQKNTFTAQGRSDPNQSTGISIHNCTIQAAPDLGADPNRTNPSYLGRPWHTYSRTVYMQSYIADVIDPVGWLEWNETVGLDMVFYGEFENYGPGADTSKRVQWAGYRMMNISEAMNFTVYNFTMGDTWLPYADIPFVAGLL